LKKKGGTRGGLSLKDKGRRRFARRRQISLEGSPYFFSNRHREGRIIAGLESKKKTSGKIWEQEEGDEVQRGRLPGNIDEKLFARKERRRDLIVRKLTISGKEKKKKDN